MHLSVHKVDKPNSCLQGRSWAGQDQTSKIQQLTTPAKIIKITMWILLLLRGSCLLQFRASAVIGVHEMSFPICFCPQMLWLGHNMLWLSIPKQRYWSSEGQSNYLEEQHSGGESPRKIKGFVLAVLCRILLLRKFVHVHLYFANFIVIFSSEFREMFTFFQARPLLTFTYGVREGLTTLNTKLWLPQIWKTGKCAPISELNPRPFIKWSLKWKWSFPNTVLAWS